MRLPIKLVITGNNSFMKRIWVNKITFFSSKNEVGKNDFSPQENLTLIWVLFLGVRFEVGREVKLPPRV